MGEVIGNGSIFREKINSLFYELKYAQNNIQQLNNLLSLVAFLYKRVNFKISRANLNIIKARFIRNIRYVKNNRRRISYSNM